MDLAYLRGRAPDEVARQLCQGGADLIQLRAKRSSVDEISHMAKAISSITCASSVGLVINDHVSVAREVGAEFCHLGQEDFFCAGFSRVSQVSSADSPIRIGLSTHAPEQARRAVEAGASYLAVGPVYATGTKPDATPVTLKYVRWASENVSIPWFAIGGINLDNVDEVVAAGASRICVVSAILNSEDIEATCRAFKRRLFGERSVGD